MSFQNISFSLSFPEILSFFSLSKSQTTDQFEPQQKIVFKSETHNFKFKLLSIFSPVTHTLPLSLLFPPSLLFLWFEQLLSLNNFFCSLVCIFSWTLKLSSFIFFSLLDSVLSWNPLLRLSTRVCMSMFPEPIFDWIHYCNRPHKVKKFFPLSLFSFLPSALVSITSFFYHSLSLFPLSLSPLLFFFFVFCFSFSSKFKIQHTPLMIWFSDFYSRQTFTFYFFLFLSPSLNGSHFQSQQTQNS